jgi:phage terminase large subunit GpA-like protein
MAADLDRVFVERRGMWRPPPRLTLSEWADEHYYLSAESSAEPGRWTTLPYQRGIMDAITDPTIERISWMKSARVGATKIMGAAIAYHIHYDPCPMLAVQPTVEDAEGYSKEEIAPLLRDCKVLHGLVKESSAKKSAQTILHKSFPGGLLSMVGANSPRGFRRVSRRIVFFDEVDGYPPSAGPDGDQIALGIRRTDYYWNRKIIAASTPLTAGASRIEEMFEAGDRRRYHVPCPHCGHRDILVFHERPGERGHWMAWPDGEPEQAHFVCSANCCIIEDKDKRAMLAGGEWIAEGEFNGHASFHLWAAYSLSPNATWGQIATEFIEAKKRPDTLKTFVNTALGETWHERGEAPDWERLYQRRESYAVGTVPERVRFLTCGVDVQKDRLVYEVEGWAENKESWSIEVGQLYGDTSDAATWVQLDALLGRTFEGDGGTFTIALLAIDSGYNTQTVYNWARRYPMNRVIACKGVATARTLIGAPSPVDVTVRGKRHQRGYKMWPIGINIAKTELYGWLRLLPPLDGEEAPPGYCHFPELDAEFFRQLTAEQIVTVRKRNGFTAHEWQMIPGRENHWLDTRILNRAAAARLGIDRMSPDAPPKAPRPQQAPPAQHQESAPERPSARAPKSGKGGWLSGGRKGGWLGKR